MGLFDFLFDVGSAVFDSLLDSATENYNRKCKEVNRKVKDYNRKIDEYERNGGDKQKVAQARAKVANITTKTRSTDAQFASNAEGMDKSPSDFQCVRTVPLSSAIDMADDQPGVYILYLNGKVMKCGRAAYSNGVRWRLSQYYNLNYDNRARCGEYWSVSEENRDNITVSWQCCPQAVCQELEYKLFEKYGKGPWAHRAPKFCTDDRWKLLI